MSVDSTGTQHFDSVSELQRHKVQADAHIVNLNSYCKDLEAQVGTMRKDLNEARMLLGQAELYLERTRRMAEIATQALVTGDYVAARYAGTPYYEHFWHIRSS